MARSKGAQGNQLSTYAAPGGMHVLRGSFGEKYWIQQCQLCLLRDERGVIKENGPINGLNYDTSNIWRYLGMIRVDFT